MKLKPAFLVLLALAGFARSQSISVNFGANETNGSINTASGLTAGAIPVAGTFWNNASGANGSASSLLDSTGAASGVSVTWASGNTWRSASPGTATATSQNGILTKGYLDDSSNSHLVTFNNVPYLKYNVYFIGATDQTGYTSPKINGVNYTYTGTPGSGSTTTGTANWGNTPWSNANTLVEGGIYLKIAGQTSTTLTVKGGSNAANSYNRGSFSAVQIENAYTGTISYWDINGTTAGSGGTSPSGNWNDANWSSSAAGTATPGAWTSGNAAVFAAGSDATGAYTVNLGGTQTADIVWVQEGQITLTGGQLNLSGTSTLRCDGTGSITANVPVGGTGLNTIGNVTLGAANVYTGATNVNSGTLQAKGGSAIPDTSGVVVNSGASLLLGASETVGTLQGAGTVALDTNTLTVTNSGTNTYAGIFTGTGAAVFTGTGTVALTGSSASFTGGLTVAPGVTLQVANSATVFGTNAGSTTVQNGGTIMVSSPTANYNQPGANENFILSGAGVGGVGALSSNGGGGGGIVRQITLVADTTIGGTARWDLGGGTAGQQAVINGGGFVLTKNGTNNIWMRGSAGGASVTNLASLVINQGVFGVEYGDNALGTTPVTVNAGGTFSVWTASPTNTQGNPITLNGGTLDVDTAGVTFSGPVTLTASSTVNSDAGNMTVSGPIGQSGGSFNLTKTAANTLTLSGANTYTGSTTVNAGTLAVANGSALPDNGPLTLNGGGLQLDGDETVGTLSGTTGSAINLGASTLTVNQAANGVILGAVSGTGSIVKQGTGTLVFNADNSHSGTTTVNAGTLQLGGTNASTTLTVNSGAGLRVGPVAGAATSARTVKSAVLAASTQSTYRLGTNWDTLQVTDVDGLSTGGAHTINVEAAAGISAGTYALIDYDGVIGGSGYTFTLGSMPHIVAHLADNTANTSVDLVIDTIDTLVWKANIDSGWDTNNKANWVLQSNSASVPFFPSDNVEFNDTAVTGNVTVVGGVSPGSIKIKNNTVPYVIGGAAISGSATLTKEGPGTATLTNDNAFTGLTTVSEGVLVIGNGTSGSLAPAASIQVDGGEIRLNPATGSTLSNPILINSSGTCKLTGSGDIALNTALTNASTGALVFNRTGTIYCNVANQTAGTVTIQSGTVAVDGSQVNNRFANNKVVTINAGGTLAVLGVNAIPGGAVNAMDPAVNGGTLQFVTGGSPAVGAAGQSHAHIRNLTLTGGTLLFSYSGGGTAYGNESVLLNGNLTVNGTAPSFVSLGSGATEANSGLALLGERTFNVSNVTGDGSPDFNINAEVENSDTGAGAIIKTGEGTMTFNASNTYTGNTTIDGGVVEVGAAGYLYNSAYNNTANITVNTGAILRLINFGYGTAGGTGQLADYAARRVLNGGTIEVTGAGHSSGNDFTAGILGGTFRYTAAGETLTLAGNNNADIQADGSLVFETVGNITISETVAGTGNLGKTGAATLRLSGANTYAGGTSVAAGSLLVTNTTGSATGTGAVSVVNGATLGGNGSIAGNVTVAANGNLAPGTSAGTLTVGGLDVSAQAAGTGVLAFELGSLSGTSDRIAVTGTLAIGAGKLGFSDFAFSNTGGLEVGTYKLITSGAAVSGTLDPADLAGSVGGFSATLQINGNDLELVVTSATTPFGSWIAGFPGVGAQNGPADDPDRDGKPNFIEFALNSDPSAGSSTGKSHAKLATVGGTANVLTLTMAVRNGATFAADGNNQKAVVGADSLTYTVEASNILTDWGAPVVTEVTGADATAIQTGLPLPDSGWTYHTFRTDGSSATDPADFIRVKVTTP